ncbi:hypothetical protein ABIC03_001968 [Bradyrhizobium sp. RT6a]|uniref:hypothetical protein n=1 Tax=Bradyrhizobium sp. RT6a TaxID=3156381 RepID=UPI00339A3D5A
MRLAASNILRLLFIDETEASTMMPRLMAVHRMAAALCRLHRPSSQPVMIAPDQNLLDKRSVSISI